jgi:hypothetical protein
MSTKEIEYARAAQLSRWGSADDDKWTLGEWAALLSHYATRRAVGDLHSINMAEFRADVVKVGALALACIEAIDRKVP